jgi:hypothetical protein
MRFQKGVRFDWRRPRGRGRSAYRMSRAACQARLRSAAHAREALARRRGQQSRTYEETRRIELEIALATHRAEDYREMARHLGLRSYAYCWRVARNYRRGLIPMLPRDERELVAVRDSLRNPSTLQRVVPWWMVREWRSHADIWGCILLTQEQKMQAAAEFDRRQYAKAPNAAGPGLTYASTALTGI